LDREDGIFYFEGGFQGTQSVNMCVRRRSPLSDATGSAPVHRSTGTRHAVLALPFSFAVFRFSPIRSWCSLLLSFSVRRQRESPRRRAPSIWCAPSSKPSSPSSSGSRFGAVAPKPCAGRSFRKLQGLSPHFVSAPGSFGLPEFLAVVRLGAWGVALRRFLSRGGFLAATASSGSGLWSQLSALRWRWLVVDMSFVFRGSRADIEAGGFPGFAPDRRAMVSFCLRTSLCVLLKCKWWKCILTGFLVVDL
jgi:hypothetical protein